MRQYNFSWFSLSITFLIAGLMEYHYLPHQVVLSQTPAIIFSIKCDNMENLQNEVWKDIEPRFGGKYEVSNLGRFRLKKTGFIRKETLDRKGYNSQIIFLDGKATPVRIHRAVAIAFIPNPTNRPQINHKNGVRNDNRVENLEWCTPKENMQHSLFKKKGEEHKFSILNEKQVIQILKTNETVRTLSERYHVSTRTITRIKTGKIWKHLYNSITDKKPAKLSWKINITIANKIRAEYAKGGSVNSICKKYPVKKTQVGLIIQNKRWKV